MFFIIIKVLTFLQQNSPRDKGQMIAMQPCAYRPYICLLRDVAFITA